MTHTIQIKKTFWLISITLLLLAITAACTPSGSTDSPTQPEQLTMYVGSETAECVGVAPMDCLLVKFDKEAEWEFFYDSIMNFEYEPGFEYELLVTQTHIENPPADASSIQYTLVEMVSKTAVDINVGLANPASVYCEEQGGKLEFRTDEAGGTVGICIFEDGSECEEWAYFRGECQLGQSSTLAGTDWDLVTYGDQMPVPDAVPTIQFTETEINGSTGCNNFFGGYTQDGASISIAQMGSTMMACEGLMEQEAAILQMLQAAKSFTHDQTTLTIHTAEGDLVFKMKEDLPLAGTEWTLNGIAQDDAFVSTPIDGEVTAVFNNEQMAGSAGCNNYFAPYTVEGTSLTLGPVGSTEMACEDEINQREMEFLAALEGVTGYSVNRDTLTLTDATGKILIAFRANQN